MCRHVEMLRHVLERHGGGLVGISAESLEENDYRRLVHAGLCWSVLWQETYDQARYAMLHPGKTRKANFEYRLDAYERMLTGQGLSTSASECFPACRSGDGTGPCSCCMRNICGSTTDVAPPFLGTPRLKLAPGALLQESPYTLTRQQFLATIALHNMFVPATAPFVSTREDWDTCVALARGGGCLFTLNCSTTPGGYSLQHDGCQFTAHSYDAPIYSAQLKSEGLDPVFNWRAEDFIPT